MNIKVYKEFSDSLSKVWKKFEDNKKHTIFQTYLWQKNWFEYIGKHQKFKLNIILIEDQKNNGIILPFCIKSVYGIKILSFLGGNQTDYNSAICSRNFYNESNKNYWELLQNYIGTFDVIEIDKLINYESYRFFLPEHTKITFNEIAHFTYLEDSWESQKKKFRKKLTQDTNRQVKRLKLLGKLEFKIIDQKNENYGILIDEFINQKKNRYISTGAYNNFNDANVKNFYKQIDHCISEKSFIQFSILKIDDQIIATHWGAYNNRTFNYLMPTFSNKWGKYSPGKILLEHLIRWCIDKNISVFDFTIGSESYKKEWCDQEVKLCELNFSNSYKGKLYLYIRKVRNSLRSIQILIKFFRYFRKIKNMILAK